MKTASEQEDFIQGHCRRKREKPNHVLNSADTGLLESINASGDPDHLCVLIVSIHIHTIHMHT